MARTTYQSRETFFGTAVDILDLDADLQADLTSAQAFIPLDIAALREITTNDIQALAAHGGIMAVDSTPYLKRVSTSTDRALRIVWAASDSNEAQFPPVPLPPDLDSSENVIIHLLLERNTGTDDCDIDVLALYNGTGAYAADTEMGGKTTALSSTNVEEKTVTLSASNIGGHPGVLNLSLVPDAHTTDILYLYGAWIEYTREVRTS